MKPWEDDETFLARWLDGSLTAEELRAFEESPDYEYYVKTAGALDNFELEPYDTSAAFDKLHQRIQEAKGPEVRTLPQASNSKSWMYYAAAACVVGFIGLWVAFFADSSVEVLAADASERVAFPDGSEAMVSKGSSIRYEANSWDEARKVDLSGEAYFEVEKGVEFSVEVANGRVVVLGTRFNVEEEDDKLLVTCYSGKVRVEAFGEQHILTKGQSVVALVDAADQTSETDLVQPIWISPNVSLKDVPLGEVLDQLEEIYGVQFSGEFDRNLPFSGSFPNSDLDVALAQVFRPFNLNFSIDQSSKTITVE